MVIKTKMARRGNTNTLDYRNKYNHGVKTTVAERIGNYYEILRKIAGDGWNTRKVEYEKEGIQKIEIWNMRRNERSSCLKQEEGTICLTSN